ncbi:hypothetical protein LMG26685_02167 [Achromobacter mucicolens]|uniref:hypothetical protein n=1 Tax=Achromobacter mucicolens TaxID=1389922 RepID=UPI0009CF2BF1|nr:hypothetical protein [Achromobacter mucicolens]OXC91362.1 hypothetical protein BMR85_009625 [Achromobacter sp. KAs 3-5]CAB3643531.1 hypothetical protein LMG26685_02167 [Achromobacter mucicolens]
MEQPHYGDLVSRVSVLERRVDKLYAWGAAAFFTASLLSGGYIWFGNRSVNQLDQVIGGMNTMQTDVLLIKKDNERKDREWKLITQMVKKGGVPDVSKTLNDE